MKHAYILPGLFKVKNSPLPQLWLILTLAFLPLFASAQVSINVVGTETYNQNFNGLTTAVTTLWVDNTTLPGWYVQQGSNKPATIAPNNGSNARPELYSFGNSPDRSLGGISSEATGKYVYVLRLKNSTNVIVNQVNVTFDLVQWWNNPGSKERFGVSYKTGTTSSIEADIASQQLNSSMGWTIVDNRIKVPSKGRPGYKPGDRKTVSLDLNNLSLAVGQELLIRFEDAMNTKNKGFNAIGVDNVTITANPGTAAFREFHFVGGNGNNRSDLRVTENWKDAFGNSPTNFTEDFQLFYIDILQDPRPGNRAQTQTPTLEDGQTWTVSGRGSKVLLGNRTQDFSLTIASSATFNGTIDLLRSATFNIDNSNNFDLNLDNTPSINIDKVEDNTTVNYRNNGDQYISEADYFNLNVSGPGFKYLYGSSSATNTLGLDLANIYLNDFDLTVGDGTSNPGQIIRTNNNNNTRAMIVTAGLGSLQRFVPTGSSVSFPVAAHSNNAPNGARYYLPATVVQNGTADLISLQALDGYYANYTSDYRPAGDRFTQEVVNRSWVVEEAVTGGSNINLTVEWNSTIDQTPLFNFDISLLNYFTGAEWVDIFKSNRQGNGNTRQMTGRELVDLGVFSVGNGGRGNQILPVELLSFNAVRVKSLVELKWVTAAEKDNEYFTLEQSADGYSFSEFGRVKGAGNSNRKIDYSFIHRNAPVQATYYRLKQTDLDGTVSYSKVVAVDGQAGSSLLSVYPNPGTGRYTLVGVNALVDATVVDATGRMVKKLNGLDSNYQFDLSDQKAGVYFLRLTTGNTVKTLRLIKR